MEKERGIPQQSDCITNSYSGGPYHVGQVEAVPSIPNTIRDITITQLNHGYIVRVGCQTFAIENPSTLIAKLAEYINNPADTETKWNDKKLF